MYSAGESARQIILGTGNPNPTAITQLLNDPAHNVGQIMCPNKSLVGLDQLGFYPSAVSGLPDVQLALREISPTTGLPTGADVANTAIINPTAGAWAWVNTGTPFSWALVHRMIELRQHTGAVVPLGAANTVTLRGAAGFQNRFPGTMVNGAMETGVGRGWFLAARNSADPSVIVGLPFSDFTNTHSTASVANEIVAAKFVSDVTGVPAGCRLSGFPIAADTTHRVGIYNTAGVAICETETLDENWGNAWTTGSNRNKFPFSTIGQIQAGTTYYLGMRSISAAVSRLSTVLANNNSHFAALPGGAANNIISVFSAGAWVDTNTKAVQIAEIYFSSITPGSGVFLRATGTHTTNGTLLDVFPTVTSPVAHVFVMDLLGLASDSVVNIYVQIWDDVAGTLRTVMYMPVTERYRRDSLMLYFPPVVSSRFRVQAQRVSASGSDLSFNWQHWELT